MMKTTTVANNPMRDFAMAGNRAMRRAAAKADRKKGRPRVNHSRRRLIDVIEYAREGAQLVRPSEVARMTAGLRSGIEHMRSARAATRTGSTSPAGQTFSTP